ncbi:hypothetical protein BHM03_00030421 [Ensete ventricosum]|nr:hypothetical protein BHM03_00030421 [Ensete ventricosum]
MQRRRRWVVALSRRYATSGTHGYTTEEKEKKRKILSERRKEEERRPEVCTFVLVQSCLYRLLLLPFVEDVVAGKVEEGTWLKRHCRGEGGDAASEEFFSLQRSGFWL